MSRFLRHKTLDFIIREESTCKLDFDATWLVNEDDEAQAINSVGPVVYDPLNKWGVGYESENWATFQFEEVNPFITEVDEDNEMWTVIDIMNECEHYGGYKELGEEKDYRVDIEWDSFVPSNYEEIEELIKKAI